jgi:hypothetical protein
MQTNAAERSRVATRVDLVMNIEVSASPIWVAI